jgi:protein gp37
MATTKIEWADDTLNDQGGCTKVSEACVNCYAVPLSTRIWNMSSVSYYEGVTNGDMKKPGWSGRVNTDLDRRRKQFRKIRNATKSKRTFYGSMTDLWHESLEIDGEALQTLAECVESLRTGCRTHQVVMFLTKRPERLLAWQRHYFKGGLPPQVWVGCTVENQKRADERIPVLIKVKAAVRYLSCEPIFGPIEIRPPNGNRNAWTSKLEWVIGGGESGFKARPFGSVQWVRELRDQSNAASIPFHFKQWGEWDEHGVRVGKKKAGRELDGRTWDEFPPWVPEEEE